jgi:hypothetical protein
VLSTLDESQAVAHELGAFLTPPTTR